MALVYVRRKARFNAAHRLHNPKMSDEWNQATFGKCNNPNWHGHNYTLEVTVKGEPDKDTGYVIDLSELKEMINRRIVDVCDHSNLNQDVPFLEGIIPSTENLVVAFWNELVPELEGKAELHLIRLYETENNVAEYRGE